MPSVLLNIFLSLSLLKLFYKYTWMCRFNARDLWDREVVDTGFIGGYNQHYQV